MSAQDINKFIANGKLGILVKPNADKNEILGWDGDRKRLIIRIAAPPEKNKANRELVKFLSKALKKKVFIISGLKSREKTIGMA